MLAKIESLKAGYDEAILLDEHGHVCEGSGENIYVVRDGAIVTPPQTASILDGITRRSVHPDRARPRLHRRSSATSPAPSSTSPTRSSSPGTAAELVPVREIDDHAIGDGRPGEITQVLQRAFEDALRGRNERYLRVARRRRGRERAGA